MEFLNITTAPLYICFGLMGVAFLLAVKWNFYSLVDAVWAYLFTVVVFIYAGAPTVFFPRSVLLLMIVSIWSTRLGTHLFLRLRAHYPEEDGRYIELKRKWEKNLKLNFFIFFLFQGFSVVILSLPFLLISQNTSPSFHWLEFLGVLIWFVGIAGESIADQQLKAFKLDPNNKGKVCQIGLWNYSRHPNYFFEWLIWVGYFVFALPAPMGWLGSLSPIIMLYLLLKMTGIPYTESQAIKTRGDLYRAYQKTTSMFVPWFKSKQN